MPNVAVVTGASGALGAEVARHLAARGHGVALIGTARSADALRTLAAQIEKELGARARPIETDVTDPVAWKGALERIEADLGAPTHAVFAAGAWKGGKAVHAEADDVVFRAMIHTNVDSVYGSLRALLPGMVARRRGSIVVVGSRAVERPWTGANAAAYTASKAAVVALAQAVAAEVLEHGVRVNAVLPSTLDTPANRSAMPDADPKRWVSLASAAAAIGFLLSDDARDISGTSVPLYGAAP